MFKKSLSKRILCCVTTALTVVAITGCGGNSNPEAQAPATFAPAPTEEPTLIDMSPGGQQRKAPDIGTRHEEILTLPGRGN